jgi:sugar phosphate isomerase/epimerase
MPDFSYQLYSSRNFSPLEDTLAMLTQAGYTQVEGYGGLFSDPRMLTDLETSLNAHSLTMPTAHLGFDQVASDPKGVIEIAKRLGIRAILVPATDDRVRDAAGWAAFGKSLGEAGKPLMDAGLQFGWHNHDFEYAQLDVPQSPLDLIMAGNDDLMLELDLAWVQVAGSDPVGEIEKWANRLVAVHVKDIAPAGENLAEDGWADVGHGVMDWPAIVDAVNRSTASYLVIEHDNPADHHRFATRSIAAAAKMGWANT